MQIPLKLVFLTILAFKELAHFFGKNSFILIALSLFLFSRLSFEFPGTHTHSHFSSNHLIENAENQPIATLHLEELYPPLFKLPSFPPPPICPPFPPSSLLIPLLLTRSNLRLVQFKTGMMWREGEKRRRGNCEWRQEGKEEGWGGLNRIVQPALFENHSYYKHMFEFYDYVVMYFRNYFVFFINFSSIINRRLCIKKFKKVDSIFQNLELSFFVVILISWLIFGGPSIRLDSKKSQFFKNKG